ncbi:MAG: orotidine-5'-phosphate decarboxylase [Xenococcus sp. MO_188.B8]|nr:orotidine-5'-phosphate decarboxylase [Xenococcus sp. MO_188.B8]
MGNTSLISTKNIPPAERLIFALDVDNEQKAKELVTKLDDTVSFYKLGLEFFMSGSYYSLLDWLLEKNKKIFVDLKFFDVPQTVASAVKQLKNKGVTFATVHGNDSILQAAVAEKGDSLKILAVTVLTSLDRGDLDDLGFQCDVKQLVLSRAKRAFQLGCDGVISSGLEAKDLRNNLADNFLIVTPGIRPVDNKVVDDQKRTVDVEEAFTNGADYIVIGRPIREAQDPYLAAKNIQERISKIFD